MTLRSVVFALLLATAIRAQGIAVSISSIPTNATRLVCVVDGGALSHAIRNRLDVNTGAGAVTLLVSVPNGGPYRVRVIAYTAGPLFPAVLRSGKASGVSVSSNSVVSASVVLADVTGGLDPSTPSSGNAGNPATFKANVTDSGDFLAGISLGEIWYATSPFVSNLNASLGIGTLTATGGGSYHFTDALNLPASAGTLYYQFAASSPAFNDPSGNETPFFAWPNLETGATLEQISVAVYSSLNVLVANIPTAATSLVAVVDGGVLGTPLRSEIGVAPGANASRMSIGVPSGGPYRVRVIAFTSGSIFPAVLRSGKASGVSVSPGSIASVPLSLLDVSATLDPSTPASASAGGVATPKANVSDPGDFLAGVTSGQIWYATSPFTPNLNAAVGFGTLTSGGSGVYQLTETLSLPTNAGTIFYQFGASSPSFKDPSGNETPYFVWPNLDSGQLQQMLVVANSAGVSISLNAAGCYTAIVTGVQNHATTWTMTPQIGTLEVVPMLVGITPSPVGASRDELDVACYKPPASGAPASVLLTAASVTNPSLTGSITIDGHTGLPLLSGARQPASPAGPKRKLSARSS